MWCLDGEGDINRGVNLVPIGGDILDATRYYELVGIYTIICIVQYMDNYFHITDAAIEVGSDYESGLD